MTGVQTCALPIFEIDKAIKRGEKPSVIAQIKKYQEQQEAYEKRKDKTKDYYRNEER